MKLYLKALLLSLSILSLNSIVIPLQAWDDKEEVEDCGGHSRDFSSNSDWDYHFEHAKHDNDATSEREDS